MARGSSLWDRYLQAESRLVGLGLVEKRKEKKESKPDSKVRKSKDRDDIISEVPMFGDINITKKDMEIYQRNIELLKNGGFMEDKHSLYHIGLRARLARMAGYNYAKGAVVPCGNGWKDILKAIDVFIDKDTGMMYFTYAIQIESHFDDVLLSVQKHGDVYRGVRNAVIRNRAFLHLDYGILCESYVKFIDSLFELNRYVSKGLIVRRSHNQLLIDIPLNILGKRNLCYNMEHITRDVSHVKRLARRDLSPAIVDLFIANFLIPPSGFDWAHGYDHKTIIRVDGDDTHYLSSRQRSDNTAKKNADMLNKLWK